MNTLHRQCDITSHNANKKSSSYNGRSATQTAQN